MKKTNIVKQAEKDILANFLSTLVKFDDKKKAIASVLKAITSVDWLPIEPKGGVFLVSKSNPKQLELYVMTDNFTPELHLLCKKNDFGHCICGKAAATREIVFVDCVDDRHDVTFEGITPHGHYSVPFFDSYKNFLVF